MRSRECRTAESDLGIRLRYPGFGVSALADPRPPYCRRMRMRRRVPMVTGLIAGAWCISGLRQAAAVDLSCFSETSCYFVSPTRNISCELHTDYEPASAYC